MKSKMLKAIKPFTNAQLKLYSDMKSASDQRNMNEQLNGTLIFEGKAVFNSSGALFENGVEYRIRSSDIDILEELGKGHYGTVQKVFHKPTNVIMAMKEISVGLDKIALSQLLMELNVLHQCQSEYIVDFYGAFYVDNCVYCCMEYMDGGSLDKLYPLGMSEDILCYIAYSMLHGLKFLKDHLQVIHRDVKPSNILCNTLGQIKLCDFGVSGQLTKSLAKTSIGCQSYMAPERIVYQHAETYTVQTDVWSFGLSLLEMALGYYPFPSENYKSLFMQLNAIVSEPLPSLPPTFSNSAHDFIFACLQRDPLKRATYQQLLEYEWFKNVSEKKDSLATWVKESVSLLQSSLKNDTNDETDA